MRNHTMPDKDALNSIRPKTRGDRKALLGIIGYIAIPILAAVGLLYARYKTQQYREQNWDSAIASIEDVRPKLASEHSSQFGGSMLYSVQVLAKFSKDSTMQERWIDVDRPLESLSDAELQKRLWIGKQYFVRWKPANPDQIIIELH